MNQVSKRSIARRAAALGAILALGGGTAALSTVSASAATTSTAKTVVSNAPDSGAHGNNWALDNYTRAASVTLTGEVALSFCGGSTPTGHCYHWTGSVTDSGKFTTRVGQTVPGNGSLNGGAAPLIGTAVTGTMNGGAHYDFYSSWGTAHPGYLPATWDDHGNTGTGHHTTGNWYKLFFGNAATFSGTGLISNASGWTYVAAIGSDGACPNVGGRWVDAGASGWGSTTADGNILAPDAAHC